MLALFKELISPYASKVKLLLIALIILKGFLYVSFNEVLSPSVDGFVLEC